MLLTPGKSEEFQLRLREAVDAALKEKGVSGRKASLDVVGNDGLIRDIRAGVLPSADRIHALFEYLGIDYTYGRARSAPSVAPVTIDGNSYSHIPLHDAVLSAGPGVINGDAAVVDQLAFRNEWLVKTGVSPNQARVARVRGDSMAPAIGDGDLVLIDTSKSLNDVPKRAPKDRRPPPVFAFIQDGEARVKRLERMSDRSIALLSDNAAFPSEAIDPASVDFQILGQVVWSGHVWR